MSNPNNGATELELTFLAREIPHQINGIQPKRLVDVYIPDDPDVHSRLRLRQKGSKYELTKKVPVNHGDASEQTEYTVELDHAEFKALSAVSNKRVEKDRYNVELDGSPAEIDVFRGLLEGLVVIDFEFNTSAEKDSFKPPAECLADVTQEDFIAGGQLAGKTYADIEPELNRFNYSPLSLN